MWTIQLNNVCKMNINRYIFYCYVCWCHMEIWHYLGFIFPQKFKFLIVPVVFLYLFNSPFPLFCIFNYFSFDTSLITFQPFFRVLNSCHCNRIFHLFYQRLNSILAGCHSSILHSSFYFSLSSSTDCRCLEQGC